MLHARLLIYLDEVARCQSMRQAGERLNIAGSAINRQILALEAELGTKIFERHPHKLVLTAAGELLIRHVRQTIADMEQTIGKIEALPGLGRGQVAIGISSGLAGTLMPTIVSRVRHVLNRVNLRVRIMSDDEMIDALLDGELDLCMGFNLSSSKLKILGERDANLGAVVASNHPLAARSSVSIGECAAYPLCVAQAPLTLRRRLDNAFEAAAVPLRPVLETDSIELMRCVALDEPFVTFLSPYDTYRERRAGRLIHIPVLRVFSDPETLIFATHRGTLSPHAARVADVMQAALDETW